MRPASWQRVLGNALPTFRPACAKMAYAGCSAHRNGEMGARIRGYGTTAHYFFAFPFNPEKRFKMQKKV